MTNQQERRPTWRRPLIRTAVPTEQVQPEQQHGSQIPQQPDRPLRNRLSQIPVIKQQLLN